MIATQSTLTELDQPPHRMEDECGDTASASSTNASSDPETIFSCNDSSSNSNSNSNSNGNMLLRTIEPLFEKMDLHDKGASDDPVAAAIEESFASLDSDIDWPDVDGGAAKEMRRNVADPTDGISSDDNFNSADNNAPHNARHQQQQPQPQPQPQRHLLSLEKELSQRILEASTLTGHQMLSELDQIESKIKAAIHTNQRIRCKSGELESVLREIDGGREQAGPDAGDGRAAEFKRQQALNDNTAVDIDIAPALDEPTNNITLNKKIASLTSQIAQLNKSKLRSEQTHKKTISKLKKQLDESNQLVTRLQSKKLEDMENNFITSIDLLEARMSREINEGDTVYDDYEAQLAALREERDTARQLNLPLFEHLKKLYRIKSELDQKVEGLLQSEEDLVRKEKSARDDAARLSNEVLLAREEISRLSLQMTSITEEKDAQIALLRVRLEEETAKRSDDPRKSHDESQDNRSRYCNTLIQDQECANTTIVRLWKENELLKESNARLFMENASLKNEEEDVRWKLEALRASTDLQLREREDRISQLESSMGTSTSTR